MNLTEKDALMLEQVCSSLRENQSGRKWIKLFALTEGSSANTSPQLEQLPAGRESRVVE